MGLGAKEELSLTWSQTWLTSAEAWMGHSLRFCVSLKSCGSTGIFYPSAGDSVTGTSVEDRCANGILHGRAMCPHTEARALVNSLEEGQGRTKSPLDGLGRPHGLLPHVPPLSPLRAEPDVPPPASRGVPSPNPPEPELFEEREAVFVPCGHAQALEM